VKCATVSKLTLKTVLEWKVSSNFKGRIADTLELTCTESQLEINVLFHPLINMIFFWYVTLLKLLASDFSVSERR